MNPGRLLRCLEVLLLLAVVFLCTPAVAQVTVGVAAGLDVRATDPGAGSSGFYPELSLRVPLADLVSIEAAGGYHSREIDLVTHGYTLSEHQSLRQYQFTFGVLLTPAISATTRLLIPIGASATATTALASGRTYGGAPYSYETRGTDFGGYVGLGLDAAVGAHTSMFFLGRYVWCPSGYSPSYVTGVVGVGYRF